MRNDRERLIDIQEAIERIDKYTAQGQETFARDELIQVWVVHHLQIIGEAARAMSDEIRKQHSEVPWSQIIGMRNILVHDYFGVDEEIVWNVVKRDLPNLKRQIELLLQKFG